MNWDAIGALGEIAGALAVVVSIVYLSIQIRSNTRAMKAGAGFDATHSWATINEQVVLYPDEIMPVFIKAFDPDERMENFSELERVRLGAHFRALFQKLEGQYHLVKYGYLDPDIWETRRTWARGAIDLPVLRAWWDQERTESIFTEDFILIIESAEPIRVSVPSLRSLNDA